MTEPQGSDIHGSRPDHAVRLQEAGPDEPQGNIDSGIRSKPHLKVQLIETNREELPPIRGFSDWSGFDDTGSWYVCGSGEDYYVLHRATDRVWALYSQVPVDSFKATVNGILSGCTSLDNC